MAITGHHPSSIVGVFDLPTPLARLYGIASQTGVEIRDHDATSGDDTAAIVTRRGKTIALNPALDSDDLRADVLAMALDVAARITSHDTGHPGAIAAPGGLVIITGNRMPAPGTGPGAFATLLARKCGRDTASAAFAYRVPKSADSDSQHKDRGRPAASRQQPESARLLYRAQDRSADWLPSNADGSPVFAKDRPRSAREP